MATTKSVSLSRLGIKKVEEAGGISEYRLKNGLKILLKENHSAPVASFMIVYRVGSRNEAVGYTGSTHFLEHMMFKGTKKYHPAAGTGVMETFGRLGALLNATTSYDRTNYFECLGSEHLPLAIKVEADRMRGLLLNQEDRDSEMSVVRNEFERGENHPGGVLHKELLAVAFREHPYHHPIIGWQSDVEGVPMERMKEFYDTYYWPNNATVIVVGDFQTEVILRQIEAEFGKIPSSPHPIPEVYTVEPPQEGERRFEIRRAGDLPQLMIGYHTPEGTHSDTYALSVLHAVLGSSGRRSSRLYEALVESGLAVQCFAQNGEARDPQLFVLGATPSPGKTLEEVEAAIYKELEKLAKEPVTDEELVRVRKANRKGTILAMSDPQSFANMLCQAESLGTWKWLIEYDDKFDAVTAADVMRVAGKYLVRTNRTVGYFYPEDNQDKVGIQSRQPAAKLSAKKGKAKRPTKLGKRPKLARPQSREVTFKSLVHKEILPNGLTVLVMNNPGTGSVAVTGTIQAGGIHAPDQLDVVPPITASMLCRGSAKYGKMDVAKAAEEMGTDISFSAGQFCTHIGSADRSIHIASDDYKQLLPIIADLLQHPNFPAEELALVKTEWKAFVQRSMSDTGEVAENAFKRSTYPAGHPFYEPSFEELLAQLDAVSVEHLRQFHTRAYSPKATTITVVGDIDVATAVAELKAQFGNWSGEDRLPITVPEVPVKAAGKRLELNLNDKKNVDIVVGMPTSMARSKKDFFAASIANAALGRDTIGNRLGKMIRVKHGLTYGVNSSFADPSFGASPWYITLSVNPVNVGKALGLVQEVWGDYLKTGITDEELEDEAGRSVGSFMVSLRSSNGIAKAISRFEFLGLGVEALDNVAADYYAVTKAEVNQALRDYLDPKMATTVIAGTLSRVK